jgi:hypothetical protein
MQFGLSAHSADAGDSGFSSEGATLYLQIHVGDPMAE